MSINCHWLHKFKCLVGCKTVLIKSYLKKLISIEELENEATETN